MPDVEPLRDPSDFTSVLELSPGILGPKHGAVAVDLLEHPNATPLDHPGQEVARQRLADITPNVLIRVYRSAQGPGIGVSEPN